MQHATTPARNAELTPALAWEIFADQVPTTAPDEFDSVALEGTLHELALLALTRSASDDGARFLRGM